MPSGFPGSGSGLPKLCGNCGIPFVGQRLKVYCTITCRHATRDKRSVILFWEKVDKSAGPDGCWLYTGFKKWDGYGWLNRYVDGSPRWLTSHRYSWILANGLIKDGLHVLHKCDNPPCCNPAHLWLGTHAENHADKKAKGRASGRNKKLWPDRVRPVKGEKETA